MQEEIMRIRRLRDEALELAGLAANPPHSSLINASGTYKTVDAFDSNIKNVWEQRAEARRQTTTRS